MITINRKGIAITVIVLIGVSIAVWLQGPIPQPLEYHNFADTRAFLSTPNMLNVLSNIPFIVVGAMGLFSLLITKKINILDELKSVYFFLFFGLFLVGFGSGYYHLWPNNETLVWDRLPMTLSFMALIAVIIGEYISVNLGKKSLYPLLVIGTASVLYWYFTESYRVGDLRPYILVQFLPLIAIPLVLLFMKPTFSHTNSYWWLIFCYVLAKMFEELDSAIFQLLPATSGHTIKHIIAALGMYILLTGYKNRHRISASQKVNEIRSNNQMDIKIIDDDAFELRLLTKDDGANLGIFFESLSNDTRLKFGPHPLSFDYAQGHLCENIGQDNVNRYIVTSIEEVIGYFIVDFNDYPEEKERYASYGIALNPKKDPVFAPVISDKYQGQGVASLAMTALQKTLKKTSIRSLVLMGGTQEPNEMARSFYEKFGFEENGQFITKHNDLNNLDMRLVL
jgi:RimJ/RimL family protein N-acetyltransferase